jgi:hypothetical protein
MGPCTQPGMVYRAMHHANGSSRGGEAAMPACTQRSYAMQRIMHARMDEWMLH